jgi:hypothetical protein
VRQQPRRERSERYGTIAGMSDNVWSNYNSASESFANISKVTDEIIRDMKESDDWERAILQHCNEVFAEMKRHTEAAQSAMTRFNTAWLMSPEWFMEMRTYVKDASTRVSPWINLQPTDTHTLFGYPIIPDTSSDIPVMVNTAMPGMDSEIINNERIKQGMSPIEWAAEQIGIPIGVDVEAFDDYIRKYGSHPLLPAKPAKPGMQGQSFHAVFYDEAAGKPVDFIGWTGKPIEFDFKGWSSSW